MPLNSALRILYTSALPGLSQMYASLDSEGVTDYVGPLLIHCWEDRYLASRHRLMIFGQETYGWYEDYMRTGKDVDECLKQYKDFRLGEGYSSLFWQYAHLLNEKINGKDDLNFVWANVNRFGVDGAGKPDQRVLDNEVRYFNVLPSELEILKPDICIFLSGPSYDGDLARKLPDLKILPFQDYPLNEAARLQSSHLPFHSYRTYHPGYGNRYKDWYIELLDKIVSGASV